jgi:glycosyl transferase family 25
LITEQTNDEKRSDVGLPPVFLINLQRDRERLQIMTARLQEIGLDFKRIEGVVGADLNLDTCQHYDGMRRRKFFGRDLKHGEMGCLLSHRKIYQLMLDKKIPYALVLEDDVQFSTEFPEILRKICTLPRRWDMVRFLGSKKITRLGRRRIQPLWGEYFLARIRGTHGGTHAYLLTLNAAKLLLKQTDRAWLPIDAIHGRCWVSGIESFVVHPAPLTTDPAAGTTIGDTRFDKTLMLSKHERYFFPIRRFMFKLGEGVGKRWVFWKAWVRDGRGRTERD